MIEIKDITGQTILSLEIGKGCKRAFTLMKHDYILLKFSLAKSLAIGIGSYVELDDWGRFEVTDLYQPTRNAKTGGWDYELQLNATYWKWKNKIFKFAPDSGSNEASWSLTAGLDAQMGIFLRNLAALGYTHNGTPYTFTIDGSVANTAKLMTYDSQDLLNALFAMAETWETEVWVADSVINFGRCEFGDAVDFDISANVESMTPENTRQTYATRLYAFGSERNIPKNYRPTDDSVVVNGVVQKRLMLPEETPFLDAIDDMPTEEAVETVMVFDDIYPRFTSAMSGVSTKQHDVVDEDGQPTGEKWNAYRYKDTSITFKNEYILKEQSLSIVFQTGFLAGMTFGVIFNPDDKRESTPDAQTWEIVRNEDYGRLLPDDTLHPKNGDTFILTGWDATKIAELGLVAAAEAELLVAARKALAKLKQDPNTYACKMISASLFRGDDVILYSIGDKVNLVNDGIFATGSRESRIIGYEYNLLQPFNSPIYIVGEKAAYSRLSDLEGKVETLTLAGQTYTGGKGGGVYVIRTHDNTPYSDANVLSSLRSKREFLSRLNPDTAQGLIRFLSGLKIGADNLGISADGDATLNTFSTPDFSPGDLGAGFGVYRNGDSTKLEVDELLVRRIATFLKLEIRELAYVAGNIVLSQAASEIAKVEPVYNGSTLVGWKCSWVADDGKTATTNTWKVGDQARCQTFNIAEPVYDNLSNHYYWRLVTEVGQDYVILSATDRDSSTDNDNPNCVPHAGDKIVQMGYRLGTNATEQDHDDTANRDRTSLLMLCTGGDDAPCIKAYSGIVNYSLGSGNMVFQLAPTGVVFNSEYFRWTSGGISYPQRVYMGDWVPGTTARYFGEYDWRGCTWLCVNPNGTTADPDLDSTDWKLVAGDPATLTRRMRFYSEYGDYDTFITYGDTVHFYAVIEDGRGNNRNDEYEDWKIERSTDDTAADNIWKVTRASISANGEFDISWTPEHDDLQAERATFTITATLKASQSTQVTGILTI